MLDSIMNFNWMNIPYVWVVFVGIGLANLGWLLVGAIGARRKALKRLDDSRSDSQRFMRLTTYYPSREEEIPKSQKWDIIRKELHK